MQSFDQHSGNTPVLEPDWPKVARSSSRSTATKRSRAPACWPCDAETCLGKLPAKRNVTNTGTSSGTQWGGKRLRESIIGSKADGKTVCPTRRSAPGASTLSGNVQTHKDFRHSGSVRWRGPNCRLVQTGPKVARSSSRSTATKRCSCPSSRPVMRKHAVRWGKCLRESIIQSEGRRQDRLPHLENCSGRIHPLGVWWRGRSCRLRFAHFLS